jgi:activating signal cointegrator 1
MKALTLTQPWATLVAIGAKHIETRSWETLYRGPLAIHAAKGLGSLGGKRGLRALVGSQPFFSALADIPIHTAQVSLVDGIVNSLPLGAIVATCELVDCVPTWTSWASVEPYFTATRGDEYWHVPPPEPERSFGNFRIGRFAWLLANIRALPEPIPCKGALGLWNYEGAL